MSLKADGKTLKSLLYAGAFALGAIFLPGCEPKDKIPPKITISSPLEQKVYDSNTIPFQWTIDEENFNSAWYSIDNEKTKNSIGQSGSKNLDLVNGSYNLIAYADDNSDNFSKENVSFSVNKIIPPVDITPPKITISSPIKNKVYDVNDISFTWNIDEENFKSAWYSTDNGSKVSITQSGTEIKYFGNGNHKIVVGAGDVAGNSSKDSVLFSADKHTWKYLVNPFIQPNDTTKPIIWNNFNLSQRISYFYDRLYNYDKTDTITAIPDRFVCTDFASVLAINFNGYGGLPPDSRGLYTNNWHNIPLYTITLMKPVSFHQVAGVVVGDDFTNINNWKIVNGESDYTYNLTDFNQMGVYKMVVNFTRTTDNKLGLNSASMFEFIPDGNGGWKDSGYRNPEINLITKRK
jgi:hypothetical protein